MSRQPIKFGKYLLLERIAVGGMAEVFVAKSFGVEGFERLMAIKKILPTMGEDSEFNTMFVDEARISVQLSHANIVQVHDLGKQDDSLYIAMEYISGRDVRQVMERFRKRGRAMPVPQACTIVAKICEALDYAHRKRDATGRPLGIVHRDVSPQNVLVSFEGDVKLIDFGIAKAESRMQRTQAGILKGKFSYMSPEQVRGLSIDHRSDIFAVGVLLWEMLCGEKLFTGDSDFAVLEKVRNGAVPAPRKLNPEIPEALERVVLKALAAEVPERYQWASELHDALVRFTLIGDFVYGSRQLSEWMREEFHVEFEKEQNRLRGWLGIEDPEIEVTPSDPQRFKKSSGQATHSGRGSGLDVATPLAARMPPGGDTAPGRPALLREQGDARGQREAPTADDAVVQPPTPTGARHKAPPRKLATPAPGELRVPMLPEVAEFVAKQQQQEDLSHDAPTRPMSMDDLAAAERHMAKLAQQRVSAPPAAFGDGDDEHTLKDGAGFAKSLPVPNIPTPAPQRAVPPPPVPTGPQAKVAPAPAKTAPPPPPSDDTPIEGQKKVTPSAGPNQALSALPAPAAIGAPPKLPPPPVPTPPPNVGSAPVAKAGTPGKPAPSKDGAAAKTDIDMSAIANETTRPMPLAQAFDVSDDPTAAPRAKRKQGLTRASREPEKPPEPRSSRGWMGVLIAVAAVGGLVAVFWPAEGAAPGKIAVTVSPSVPAELVVDGKSAGALPPFVRTLASGAHTVEVRAGGYKPFIKEIVVNPGTRPLEVEAALVLEAPGPGEQVEPKPPPGPNGEKDVVPREPSKVPWLRGSGAKDAPSGSAGENKQEAKSEAKPEAKPEAKTDAPDAKTELKADKPGAKSEAKPDAHAAASAGPDAAGLHEPVAAPKQDAPAAKGSTAKVEAAAPVAKAAAPEPAKVDPPKPQKTRLRVITDPPGAQILLADQPVGKSPAVLEDLDAATLHFVGLTLDGYKPEKRVVKFDDGPVRELNVKLVPLHVEAAPPVPAADKPSELVAPSADAPKGGASTGSLVIMSRPVAKVRIDGADTGRWTPVPPSKPIALSPGTYTIELETQQGRRYEEKVLIEAGKTVRLIKMDL